MIFIHPLPIFLLLGLVVAEILVAQGTHKYCVQLLIDRNLISSEVILYLRTIALWARNRWIWWSLAILAVVSLSRIHRSCDLPISQCTLTPCIVFTKIYADSISCASRKSSSTALFSNSQCSRRWPSGFAHTMCAGPFKPDYIPWLHPDFYFGNK